jgi:hypothetical protein
MTEDTSGPTIRAEYSVEPAPLSPEMVLIRKLRFRLWIVTAVAVFALIGCIGGGIGWAKADHYSGTVTGQQSQINQLITSVNRLTKNYGTLNNRQAQTSAKLSAADPLPPASAIITCRDLRAMGLTEVTGAYASSVPGSVSIDHGSVSLPAHCR